MGHPVRCSFLKVEFHISLVTQENIIAPFSIKVSSNMFYMTAQSTLLLSSIRQSLDCVLSSLKVKVCVLLVLLWNVPFHYQAPDFPDQRRSRVAVWQCFKHLQPFFSVGLAPLTVGWLEDVKCPGYRFVHTHRVHKQSWAFSGVLFHLDMSGLFALIKIPTFLALLHNSLLYLYCPDHIPV